MNTIRIIGGGIAGLSLALGLRQRGVPVQVFEAGKYPRHRVCGEFISGRGLRVLQRLELEPVLRAAGALSPRTASFQAGALAMRPRALPAPALSISRWAFDDTLRQTVEQRGGIVVQGSRWRGDPSEPGLVLACGRQLQPVEHGTRWVGLKIHARNVPLRADLEMHLFPDQYIGLCRVDRDRVNVCGLFRLPAEPRRALTPDLLQGPPGAPLHDRLSAVDWDEASFCAVAGLALQPRHHAHSAELRLGDALTMIPPVTGNGMSMALESAAIAQEPLAEYSHGRLSWATARRVIQDRCRNAFNRRLFWAGVLHRFLFSAVARKRASFHLLTSTPSWRALFWCTR